MLRTIRQVPRTRATYLLSSASRQHYNITKRFSSNETSAKETPTEEKKATIPKSKKPTSEKPTQEPAKLEPNTKDSESNGSAKKDGIKFKRLGRTLFGTTLFGGISYGGAVYYSLKNEDFRSWFTNNVYGSEQVVEYVEDLHRQGTFNRIENNAIKWRDYAYETISGIFNSSAPPEKSSTSGKSSTSEKLPDTVSIAPPKETSVTSVEKGDRASEEAIPIEEPIIRHLAGILDELDVILKNYDMKDEGESILKKAKEELAELNNRIEILKIESRESLQRSLSEQTQKFNKTLADYEKNVDEYIIETEASMKQKFKEEKQRIHGEHHKKLNAKLKQVAEEHDKELKNELVRQAVDMHSRWIREVKSVVERERGGRLGRLDEINHRLKVLERLSVDNAEHLDGSLRMHQLWCALKALQDAVEQPYRTPFVDQIVSLRNLSSTDEVVTTVLSTIDDSVAINGIDSISELSTQFLTVKEEVRRASLVPENGGVLSHLLSIVLSKIMFRKHGYVDGNDVEAILARVQYYLNENDLDNAARELNQLKGWPKKLAEDWIKSARDHLEVKQAIEAIEAQATLSSISVI